MSRIEGIRVSPDLRTEVEPETKRLLYKIQIESSFGFNTLAIVEGNLKHNLKEF